MGFASITLIAVVTALILWAFYLSWDVRRWDAKIDALCAANDGKDVATRVYETVMAPETKEYFVELPGRRSFSIPARSVGAPLGPQYPYAIETQVVEVLHQKDPSVVKYTERIVRVRDNTILSERFAYQRSGGHLFGFDPGTPKNCPINLAPDRLDVNTFVNHPRHSERRQK